MRTQSRLIFKRTGNALGLAAALLIAACGGGANPVAAPAAPLAPAIAEARAVDLISVNDGKGGVRAAKASEDGYAQPAAPKTSQPMTDLQKRKVKPVVTAVDLGDVDAAKSA